MTIRINNAIQTREMLSSQQLKTLPVSFRSDKTTNKLEKSPENDIVEINSNKSTKTEGTESTKNEGLSNEKKWGVGIGIAGTIAIAALLIKKNRYSEVKELAENIVFSKATSLEEAIKFGKKNLGIKNYRGFESKDLEVINWINEGLVNTSNKLKGKIRVPKTLHYTADGILGKDTLAGVITEESYSGYFGVNKTIFDNLEPLLKENINDLEEIIKLDSNGNFSCSILFNIDELRPLAKKIEDFNKNKLKTFDEKVDLLQELYNLKNECNAINNSPLLKIKNLLENENLLNIMKNNNLETNLQTIEKLPLDEQSKLLEKFLNCAKDNNVRIYFKHTKGDRFEILYHEMGHLQDDVVRPKASGKFKNPKDYPNELKEWLDNKEYQQLASAVSDYSCSGPREFIAETFAALISGKKLSQDVLNLYKKMNGPFIPGI